MTLRQLLTAEQLEQAALSDLGIDPAVGAALAAARGQFEEALPGIKDMRDALMHFDEWARGTGKYGPQARRRNAGDALRDIARDYWRFGYDPGTGAVSFGPYRIDIGVADRAAADLCSAIYTAARAVDAKNTAELRARVTDALSGAGIGHDSTGALLTVSPGHDMTIWLSLKPGAGEHERRELARKAIGALARAGLYLESAMLAQAPDPGERLALGEALLTI
jgi:hypothetical protein